MCIMDRQFKKTFSILFAILMGAGIILFAWKGESLQYIGDTVKNNAWLDSLKIIPQANTLKTTDASKSNLRGEEATTTVDIVGRALLTNYALLQSANTSTTTLSDQDAITIAQTAVGNIRLPEPKQFSLKDIPVSSDNSSAAVDSYMKKVGDLVQIFTLAQTRNDVEVAFALPGANGVNRTASIEENISHYEQLIQGLLTIRTPSLLALQQLHLIQKYANIEATIRPMAEVFTDPIKALAALAQYRREVADFTILAKEFADHLPRQ